MVCFLSFSDRNMTKVFGSVTFEKCAEPEWSRSQVNFRNIIIIQCMLKRNNPVDAKNLHNIESILIAGDDNLYSVDKDLCCLLKKSIGVMQSARLRGRQVEKLSKHFSLSEIPVLSPPAHKPTQL